MKYLIILSFILVGCDTQECPTEEQIVARIECKTTPDGSSTDCGNIYRCPSLEDFSVDRQAEIQAEAMRQLAIERSRL